MSRFARLILQLSILVLSLSLSKNAFAVNPPFPQNPVAAAIKETPAQFYRRFAQYLEDFRNFATQKPDPEQMKKLIAYYTLSDDDKKEYDEMLAEMARMTPMEWFAVVSSAQISGQTIFIRAMNPLVEESTGGLTSAPVNVPAAQLSTLPETLKANLDGFIKTSTGVLYSKHVQQGDPRVLQPGAAPIILGGGFPFNQTQFTAFNEKLARLSDVDLYDPLCNGMSVLYDAVLNDNRLCRPYKPASPRVLLRDELAIRWAHFNLYTYASVLSLDVEKAQDILFRITRHSYKGVTLAEQAKALSAIADQRGYRDGESIMTGISYGGLVVAKVGAMFHGRYKALVLFSPGIENSAHSRKNRLTNAALEGTSVHRKVLVKMVTDMAYSPRYDAYRPVCLNDYDKAFRDSLIKKMLGELDMDIRADLKRVKDPVFMFTGVQDAAIDPKLQVEAMKIVFSKPVIKGAYVLVPKGGHALWGNPAQQAETAVLRGLEEIEKGHAGAFHDGGVYVWNEEASRFDLIGEGLEGLKKAEAEIDRIKAETVKK